MILPQLIVYFLIFGLKFFAVEAVPEGSNATSTLEANTTNTSTVLPAAGQEKEKPGENSTGQPADASMKLGGSKGILKGFTRSVITEEPMVKVTEETMMSKPTELVSMTPRDVSVDPRILVMESPVKEPVKWRFIVQIMCSGDTWAHLICWGVLIHQQVVVTSRTCLLQGGWCKQIYAYNPESNGTKPLFSYITQWPDDIIFVGSSYQDYIPFHDFGFIYVKPLVTNIREYVDIAEMANSFPNTKSKCKFLDVNLYNQESNEFIVRVRHVSFEACDILEEWYARNQTSKPSVAKGRVCDFLAMERKVPDEQFLPYGAPGLGGPLICDNKWTGIQVGDIPGPDDVFFWSLVPKLEPFLKKFLASLNSSVDEQEPATEDAREETITPTPNATTLETTIPVETESSFYIQPSGLFGFRIDSQGAKNASFKFLVVLTIFVKVVFS